MTAYSTANTIAAMANRGTAIAATIPIMRIVFDAARSIGFPLHRTTAIPMQASPVSSNAAAPDGAVAGA
jgi:hypothetical protein